MSEKVEQSFETQFETQFEKQKREYEELDKAMRRSFEESMREYQEYRKKFLSEARVRNKLEMNRFVRRK